MKTFCQEGTKEFVFQIQAHFGPLSHSVKYAKMGPLSRLPAQLYKVLYLIVLKAFKTQKDKQMRKSQQKWGYSFSSFYLKVFLVSKHVNTF